MCIMTWFSYRTAQYYFHGTPAFDVQPPVQNIRLPQDSATIQLPHSTIFLNPSSCDVHFPPYRQIFPVSVLSTKLLILTHHSRNHPAIFTPPRAQSLRMESAEVSLHALLVEVPAHYKLISWSIQITVFENCDFRSQVMLHSAFTNWDLIFIIIIIIVFCWKILNLFTMQFHVNNTEHRLDTSVTLSKCYISFSNN